MTKNHGKGHNAPTHKKGFKYMGNAIKSAIDHLKAIYCAIMEARRNAIQFEKDLKKGSRRK